MPLSQNLSFILLGEDKSASKTMHGAESTATMVTGKIGASFGKLGHQIGGEFGEVLNRVGEGVEKVGEKGKTLGTALAVGGGVATAAGVGLLSMSSDLKSSTDQLNAAIGSTGKSAEEYGEDIEKAVAKGQNFNHSAVETKKALTILVGATGDTDQALKRMSIVTDLAAAKHMSLESAAGQVAKILNGSGGRTLAGYGITMEKAYNNTKDLASGHDALLKAQQGVRNAQTALTRLEEIDHGKKSLSIQDNFRLADAHQKVKDAQALVSASQKRLTDLQGTNITKTKAGADAIDQLSAKLKGQGKASVDNFGAQVSIATTKVKDWVDEVAGPLGSALSGLGPVLTVVGLGIDMYKSKQEAAAAATLAQAAAADTAVVATDAEAGAMVALDGAMDANPIGIVALALGGLAAIAGGIALANQKDLTAATKSYTDALEADNAAIGKNVRATATKALSDDGSLKKAKDLGISGGLLVDATLGVAGAQKQLDKQLAAASKRLDDQARAASGNATKFGAVVQSQKKARDEVTSLTGSVQDQTAALKGAISKDDLYNQALNTVKGTVLLTKQAFTDLTNEIDKLPSSVGLSVNTSGVAFSDSRNSAKKPHHASGGDIFAPEFAVVGENGPEVVGLPGGSHVFPSQRGGLGSGGGLVVHVHVAGSVHADERSFAKSVVTAITNAARSGSIPRNALSTALTGV